MRMMQWKSLATYIGNLIFVFLCGVLVFSMQAGFALLETGSTRSKHCSNIWLKNLMDFCVGVVCYIVVGFGLQYGNDFHGLFGVSGFLNPFKTDMACWSNCVDILLNPYIYFFFQLVFCGATATIISGAVAGRFKFSTNKQEKGTVFIAVPFSVCMKLILKTDFQFF